MTHYLSLIWCSGAPTPLSRMMKLPSPVTTVTGDGWTEHFLPPPLFTHIPDPTSGESSAISGHINHPSCPVTGLKIWVQHSSRVCSYFFLGSHIFNWGKRCPRVITLILKGVTNISWQPSLFNIHISRHLSRRACWKNDYVAENRHKVMHTLHWMLRVRVRICIWILYLYEDTEIIIEYFYSLMNTDCCFFFFFLRLKNVYRLSGG